MPAGEVGELPVERRDVFGAVGDVAVRELEPIVMALGTWGVRWIGALGDHDLDPKLLLWDMHRNVEHAALPAGRTVLRFRFPGVEPRLRTRWLALTRTDADVCDSDPGHGVAVEVVADLRGLVAVWLGEQRWVEALRSGRSSSTGRARCAGRCPAGSSRARTRRCRAPSQASGR